MKIRSNPSLELRNIRQRLAGVLLQHAGTDTAKRPDLSQREMAVLIGTSWEIVNKSLTSLQAEGAISIERHRMIINQEALERIAVETVKAHAYALLRTPFYNRKCIAGSEDNS